MTLPTGAASSSASAGEDVPVAITEADLETFHRIRRAFEARFPAWYLAEKLAQFDRGIRPYHLHGMTKAQVAQHFEEAARRCGFDSLDEDGEAKFTDYWRGEIQDSETMPFTAILGTTEEFIERHNAELQARAEAERERARKAAAEETRKAQAKREQAAREEQARRDRIFREEAKKRGLEVPS